MVNALLSDCRYRALAGTIRCSCRLGTMIVRHFLQWVRTAPAGERADATGALARAYLYSPLSADDRLAAEGAMVMLLDDPSPLVRRALAEHLAASPDAPPAVILALAGDQPEIAGIALERSPLFLDADLVELVAAGEAPAQVAIARRARLPRAVAAAIAEVGSGEACLALLENPAAAIAAFSLARMAERWGTWPRSGKLCSPRRICRRRAASA
jgi:uncharacterized protein (DUF2336 family)